MAKKTASKKAVKKTVKKATAKKKAVKTTAKKKKTKVVAKKKKATKAKTATAKKTVKKRVRKKTSLTVKELTRFRDLLIERLREITGCVNQIESEALKTSRLDSSGDLSSMPIHMADIGTDNYEREFTIGLIENETETLKEIDAALERIKSGCYGVCEATHRQIGKARLKVKPWARYCVAYKRSQEEKQNRRR